MYIKEKILVGKNAQKEMYILPNMINRHGIITGASGSGKTITLKVLAESFSTCGIPSFVVDVKGDLASISKQGQNNENIEKRINKLKIKNFQFESFPVTFLDVYGNNGHPIRTTVKNIGPKLLSKMLDLTETQMGVLTIIFKIAEDENLEIIDLKDLKSLLSYALNKKEEYSTKYGNITSQSIGSIQRRILILEEDDGNYFFGNPSFELQDLIHYDNMNGKGYVNILHAVELFKKPSLYAIFLLWILNNLYDNMPEVGDLAKPKLVLFFDEAHLLFSQMPSYLVNQIIQIVKLIRSKGIGIFFVSQSPSDIPEEILSQLGNKIQHLLRCYTPNDEKALKSAANSFRKNPKFNTEEEIKSLSTGEAIVSFIDENGSPSICEKITILPPQSLIGTISEEERKNIIEQSFIFNKYEILKDDVSAYEKIGKISNKKDDIKINKKNIFTKSKRKLANKFVNKAMNAFIKEIFK